jgi:hypothetical protein
VVAGRGLEGVEEFEEVAGVASEPVELPDDDFVASAESRVLSSSGLMARVPLTPWSR